MPTTPEKWVESIGREGGGEVRGKTEHQKLEKRKTKKLYAARAGKGSARKLLHHALKKGQLDVTTEKIRPRNRRKTDTAPGNISRESGKRSSAGRVWKN